MASMISINDSRRIVLKIGSATLVDPDGGRLRKAWLEGLAKDIADLRARGKSVIIVSSGSIALGRKALGLAKPALELEESQAAAAVGQIQLARVYEGVLSEYGITAAQILVTLDDSENRRRYLNSRATIKTLLDLGAVPIVNENDTVATDEIRYGDNDRLAAQVALMADADVLILLSDVDGFYSADPRKDAGARKLEVIEAITPDIEKMAGDEGTGLSRGGMKTKILAAKTVTGSGCAMAIMKGDSDRPLNALENGAPATWFLPAGDPKAARKNWISGMKPRGDIYIDSGAAKALRKGGSLLPAGVARVSGFFLRGDPVSIRNLDGAPLGKGLVAYGHGEADLIKGRKSGEIESVLGHPGRSVLIHRDDMVL